MPEDLWHVDVRPVFEILAKPLGVAAFGDVVHFFMNRLIELAKHSRPIGIFIQLRKAFGESRDFLQYLKVALDRGLEIRPLNLYGNLFAGEESGSVNLPERCRGDRLYLKFLVYLV